jgi:hypothetical protein
LKAIGERLLETRRAEIRLRLGAEVAEILRIVLPKTGENLDVFQPPPQPANREARPRRTQFGVEK